MNDVSIEMIPESDTIEQIGYSYHDIAIMISLYRKAEDYIICLFLSESQNTCNIDTGIRSKFN